MNIRFVSTLTADDENQIAPGLMKAISSLLDRLPIAYTIRIETTGAQVFQHSHPSFESPYTDENAPAFETPTLPAVKS